MGTQPLSVIMEKFEPTSSNFSMITDKGTTTGRMVASMDLDDVRRVAAGDSYLAVVATTRADGSVQASLVNAGFLDHPASGRPVAAFVTYGEMKKRNLRRRPTITLVWRAGWRWAAVEGRAELAGPDDPLSGLASDGLPRLLRDVFVSAGGSHDDWDEYDRVMAEQRRAAVLVAPGRVYGNP